MTKTFISDLLTASKIDPLHRVSGQQGTADRAYSMMKPSLSGWLGLGGEEVRGLG
jgi:hypothetical protein